MSKQIFLDGGRVKWSMYFRRSKNVQAEARSTSCTAADDLAKFRANPKC